MSIPKSNRTRIGTRIHIHLSETEREHTECIKKYGKTPAAYFDSLGLFNAPATAAHCVWVTEEDMDILKKKNVTVACNPVSNMKLASGVCNVPMLLEKGINVAIGTDSVASNNSLNFIEEMKFFALASKMYYNRPEAVTPKETLYAATRGGALSQGRNDTGLIKEGFKADITLVDITGRSWGKSLPLRSGESTESSGPEALRLSALIFPLLESSPPGNREAE